MDVLEDHKKEKKADIRKRNKRDWLIFQHGRARDIDKERVEDLQETLAPKPAEKEEAQIWSAKTAEIKNRLTNKKRDSKERWNRFAGTEGGGGRGL